MKKIIIFFLAVAFAFSANAQRWVNFASSEPKAPESKLLDNSRTVTFSVTLPGIYTQDTVVNGIAFTRLLLPGGGAVNPTGSPELPMLTYKVAIPNCDKVEVAYRIDSKQTLPSCWVYPVPEMVLDRNGNLVEQFAFEPAAYTQPHIVEPAVTISSSGALRSQKYVEVTVMPVEFCPVTRQLSVIDQIEITLTFNHPQGELRQNVGIFNKVAASAFINYEDNGISALVNDKAFEKPGFKRGNVQWFTLIDTADAATIPGDYLIITVPEFFKPNDPNSQLQRLADHRAFYNGFDVSIVNVDNILSLPFKYENYPYQDYIKEQKMRTFIRRVFEGKNAHDSHNPYGDGSLAYVLLVGDWDDVNGGIPGATEHGVTDVPYSLEIIPSDYYYSCVTKDAGTGKYDECGDLFIGRFCVDNETHLFNMVEKTINHETLYSEDTTWRKTTGFTNGFNYSYDDPTYVNFVN